jgi:hypothetical protein
MAHSGEILVAKILSLGVGMVSETTVAYNPWVREAFGGKPPLTHKQPLIDRLKVWAFGKAKVGVYSDRK